MLILSKKVLTSFLRSACEPVVDELIEKIGTKNSSKDDRKFKGSAPKYDCDRTVKLKSMLLQPILDTFTLPQLLFSPNNR